MAFALRGRCRSRQWPKSLGFPRRRDRRLDRPLQLYGLHSERRKLFPNLARLACVTAPACRFWRPVQGSRGRRPRPRFASCFEGAGRGTDGGRFLTLPLVFTRDPDTGRQNVGMYRMQIYDKKTVGMHWHLHKDGRAMWEKWKAKGGRMPVSVALGCDPAMI